MNKLFSAKIEKVLTCIPLVENLARKKFVSAFILSLIKTKKVQFSELAYSLNDCVKMESNERRIQSFFEKQVLDFHQVAFLLCMFLPKGKIKLVLDRTEWDFGSCQVNILAVTAYNKGIGIPIYFELLDNKSGNSCVEDRVGLLKKCIAILGVERIECVLGDREFIGKEFYKFLLENKLAFYIRMRKNQYIGVNGVQLTPEMLLKDRNTCLLDNVEIAGYFLSVAMKKVKDKNGNLDYLIVLTNTFANKSLFMYAYRWSIEVFFQSIKGRGFNLEDSQVKCLSKIKNLFAFVCIAFAICTSVGLEYHQKIKKIPIKNHQYKAKSFFRKGMDIIRELFRKQETILIAELDKWIQKFETIMEIKTIDYKHSTKIIG